MPRPRYWLQIRLAIALAKKGLSGWVIQSASWSLREKRGLGGILFASKRSFVFAFAGAAGSSSVLPRRNFGLTGSPFSPGFWSLAGPVNRTSPLFLSPMA